MRTLVHDRFKAFCLSLLLSYVLHKKKSCVSKIIHVTLIIYCCFAFDEFNHVTLLLKNWKVKIYNLNLFYYIPFIIYCKKT